MALPQSRGFCPQTTCARCCKPGGENPGQLLGKFVGREPNGRHGWSHGGAVLVYLGQAIHLWGRGVSGGEIVAELLIHVTFPAEAFQDACKPVLHFHCWVMS